MEIVIIIIIIILLLIGYIISINNKLERTKIKVNEALSGIDIALAKRYDILIKMIEVVKGYAKHEKETLFKVVNLKKNMTLQEKSKANSTMDTNFCKISAIVENYPKLKSSENYTILQKSIVDIEEHLQASRRLYNANVSLYNQLINLFPSKIVAKNKNLTEKEFFEIEKTKKDNVKIDI